MDIGSEILNAIYIINGNHHKIQHITLGMEAHDELLNHSGIAKEVLEKGGVLSHVAGYPIKINATMNPKTCHIHYTAQGIDHVYTVRG